MLSYRGGQSLDPIVAQSERQVRYWWLRGPANTDTELNLRAVGAHRVHKLRLPSVVERARNHRDLTLRANC